jgi:hypothetical protein
MLLSAAAAKALFAIIMISTQGIEALKPELSAVMRGLDPRIQALSDWRRCLDARIKSGHDASSLLKSCGIQRASLYSFSRR